MRQEARKITLNFLRRRAEEESAALPALTARAEKAAQSILIGEHAQRKSGAGEKFWQFREYDPSDRPQDIDWRQSARGDRIFVRQKERQTMQTALFWCAAGESMSYSSERGRPTKYADAATIALALAILMKHAGEKTGLLEDSTPPGRTDHAIQTIAYGLAASNGEILPNRSDIPRNADIVLCGDFLDPPEEVEQALSPLAAKSGGGILVHVLDPAEINLPFTGRAIFENADGTERHHIFQVQSVRDQYKKRISEHLAAIRNICRKNGWHYVLHETGAPVRETLAAIWAMTGHEQFSTVR